MKEKVSIFWFRRDLRLFDNVGLTEALKSEFKVLPIFIFDSEIISELPKNDARISFIHATLSEINLQLIEFGSSLNVYNGKPSEIWKQVYSEFDVKEVYSNEDYEPYGIKRDDEVKQFLVEKGVEFKQFQDHVIFAKDAVVKNDGNPYTVYTPYKNKWMERLKDFPLHVTNELNSNRFLKCQCDFPKLEAFGFEQSTIKVQPYQLDSLDEYDTVRNIPSVNGTSYLSPHLRFGTVSIRDIAQRVQSNIPFLNELIWREFFMQVLYHFPNVVNHNFRKKYDGIQWRNNEAEFEKWKNGQTGYPIVDAGMRELNATGYMHNRVRMVVASFLCKHLLIDWRWGEAYFAEKLLDYELSANNGNWQWSAGTGCDAAPYFRVFNPYEQVKKFDPKLIYIKKWVPELEELTYPLPIVEHKIARERALKVYKSGIEN